MNSTKCAKGIKLFQSEYQCSKDSRKILSEPGPFCELGSTKSRKNLTGPCCGSYFNLLKPKLKSPTYLQSYEILQHKITRVRREDEETPDQQVTDCDAITNSRVKHVSSKTVENKETSSMETSPLLALVKTNQTNVCNEHGHLQLGNSRNCIITPYNLYQGLIPEVLHHTGTTPLDIQLRRETAG